MEAKAAGMRTALNLSADDLQRWKEDNRWFLDLLQHLRVQYDAHITDIARTVLVADEEQLGHLRLRAAGWAGMASMIDNILNLSTDDIQSILGEDRHREAAE